jgi:putative FmdB family regulatory protein
MTYEYECTNPTCKHTWEEEQRITAQSIRMCPKCKSQTAKRLISKSAFILNGEGWFKSGGY